jgi:DNA-binding NarL/FixJ family response regulator
LDRTEVPAVKAALGHEGIVLGVDHRGIPVLAATRAIPDSPWFFVAKIDVTEIAAVLQERAIVVGIRLHIKRHHPEIKLLVLTMYKTREHLSRALKVGVDGYLLKENAFDDLITAINTIREGRIYISSLVSQLVQESFQMKSWTIPEGAEPLSPREKDVLKYLAEGKSNKEIAELLIISESTVRIHLGNVKKKLNIRTNVELARYALKQGYTSLN